MTKQLYIAKQWKVFENAKVGKVVLLPSNKHKWALLAR